MRHLVEIRNDHGKLIDQWVVHAHGQEAMKDAQRFYGGMGYNISVIAF